MRGVVFELDFEKVYGRVNRDFFDMMIDDD